MKKFYTLILALVGVCWAVIPAKAEGYRSVVFNQTDGTTLAITVETGMSTLVTDGYITMSCEKGVLSLPAAEVTGWTFSREPGTDFEIAGIETPEADAVEVVVGTDDIALHGLAAGTKVMLTAVDGRVVASTTSTDTVSIPTGHLTTGVYILTYNDKSIKIALK